MSFDEILDLTPDAFSLYPSRSKIYFEVCIIIRVTKDVDTDSSNGIIYSKNNETRIYPQEVHVLLYYSVLVYPYVLVHLTGIPPVYSS